MQSSYLYDVFISFNSRDKKMATDVHSFLERNGIDAFFADESLKGKASFVSRINDAIAGSKNFLLVTSSANHIKQASNDNPYGSDWVADEISKFIIENNSRSKRGKEKGKLVSFRTDSVLLIDLPLDFQSDSTAIVQSSFSSCWDDLLGCFKVLGKRETIISEKLFISDWLDNQILELNELKTNLDSSEVQIEKLTDVYVSLPTDTKISINVNNGKVIKISDNTLAHFFEDIQKSKYASLQSSINEMLSDGVEYKYRQPIYRPKILAPIWTNGAKKDYWTLNAIDVIATNSQTVVTGDPGFGKSTLLKYLAIVLSKQYDSGTNELSESTISDEFYANKYIPVYIELRDFIPWLGEQQHMQYGIGSIAIYICKKLLCKKYYYCGSEVTTILKNRCIFLLDGLDEIASSDFNKNIVCSIINDIERVSPMSKLVLSCRERDYPAWNILGVTKVELKLMDRATMYKLVKNIFRSHRCSISPAELLSHLFSIDVDEHLSGNPLFLSLMAYLYLKGADFFPKNKSSIINESINLLLERKCNDLMSVLDCDFESIKETLEEIAYEMQNRNDGRELKITRRDMIGIIGDHMENCSMANSINYFKATAGVISSQGSNEFEFTHRHFQEFLCASYMSKMNLSDVTKIIMNGLLTSPTRWSETCLLYIEILLDEDRKIEIWSLLYKLLKSIKGLSDTNQGWIVWFSAKIISGRDYALLPNNSDDYDERNDIVIQLAKDSIKNLLEYNNSLPIEQIVECADTLGYIGDDRTGVGIIDGLPEHQWCYIDYEDRDFEMGVSDLIRNEIETQQYNNKKWVGGATSFYREQPSKKIDILPFYISKYETTNIQFYSFLVANDGYNNRSWWNWCKAALLFFEKNWEKRIESLMKETQKKKNYPVTHINFFEAVAYCKWLSSKLGIRIRMPTEGEWEYAAKINGTIFTWGNIFDPLKCNSSCSGVGDLTPVGIYHLANSISQPCDMNGNAWEWCQSIYPSWSSDEESLSTYDETDNYINTDTHYNLEYDAMVAVRGGSFINPPALLRSTFRGRDRMVDYFYRQGFRVLKEITEHPYCASNTFVNKASAQNKSETGAGRKLSIGDRVRIGYKISKNGIVIQDNMLPENAIEITIGAGELNEEIEHYLLSTGASVATTVDNEFNVCRFDKSNNMEFEKYQFFIFILEIK